jgi:head-tail adaptor
VKSGRLDRRLQIQRQTETISPAGTVSGTWATLATVRAEVLQQSSTEFLREHGEAERAAIIFRLRFIPGVDLLLTDRVLFNGQAHNLVEVKEIGRRQGLELRCERVRS